MRKSLLDNGNSAINSDGIAWFKCSSIANPQLREDFVTAQYFVRQRKEENPKRWQGPLPLEKLRDLATTSRLTRNLHEISEDRVVWIPASQIWSRIFPPQVKSIIAKPRSEPQITASGDSENAMTYGLPTLEPDDAAQAASANIIFGTGDSANESAEWYYLSGDAQVGPVTLSALHGLLGQGALQPTDLVWAPSFGEQWQEVGNVREFAAPQSSSGHYDRGLQGQARAPGSTQPDPFRSSVPPMATASLVLGILGATILMGIGSVLAIIFGHLALSEAPLSGNPKKARQFAIAGLVLGYSILTLLAFGTIVYFATRADAV